MPTPSFEDAPDGSSSINHTGSILSEEAPCFWEDIDPWADLMPLPPQPYSPTEINSSAPTPHTAVAASPVAANPNCRIEARMFSQGECPPPVAPPSPPRRQRSNRRRLNDPYDSVRKDPNAWSLKEAIELCKLLEVVVPEAGFHIALTGGLLYKEGKRKDCDLMFYQIRQMEPNYEVLWKYLTVAGVVRRPEYPENGWLVKATYRGKAVDCLFPNAGSKKSKKNSSTGIYGYKGMAPAFPPPNAVITSADVEAARQTPYTAAELLATPPPAPIPPPSLAQGALAALAEVEAVRTTREEF